ncbi:MAG: hypothetical protein KF813_02635 [Trueperaceae bacterium]|nr:hypothetical protein [Trueperaceae bacterium]
MRERALITALGTLCLLAACTQSATPSLSPSGQVTARVGSDVEFTANVLEGELVWALDGVAVGLPKLGKIIGTTNTATYTAPDRVPSPPTVTVSATEADSPFRSAAAEVSVTAPGTLYILTHDTVHVYNDMDVVDGNVAPDRNFDLQGVAANSFFDMALAPELDMAFISVSSLPPGIFRISDISGADGPVTATAFDATGHQSPTGMAYDPDRDTLYVLMKSAIITYENASTAQAGKMFDRVISGSALDSILVEDSRLSLDPTADRLFVASRDGQVGVFDNASTRVGGAPPDRHILVDHPLTVVWGAAHDPVRDELYIADMVDGVNILVIAGVSTADGTVAPARTIGGPSNPLKNPSQLAYDPTNDRLVAFDFDQDDVKVYDAASTLNGDVQPSRVIGGTMMNMNYGYGAYLDPTQ